MTIEMTIGKSAGGHCAIINVAYLNFRKYFWIHQHGLDRRDIATKNGDADVK